MGRNDEARISKFTTTRRDRAQNRNKFKKKKDSVRILKLYVPYLSYSRIKKSVYYFIHL